MNKLGVLDSIFDHTYAVSITTKHEASPLREDGKTYNCRLSAPSMKMVVKETNRHEKKTKSSDTSSRIPKKYGKIKAKFVQKLSTSPSDPKFTRHVVIQNGVQNEVIGDRAAYDIFADVSVPPDHILDPLLSSLFEL